MSYVEEKLTHSPAQVAAWMLEEVEQAGILYQTDVVEYLQAKFGAEATYLNSNGRPAIAKPILAAFKSLTTKNVVWIHAAHYWRLRQAEDGPHRQR
jgi:hypothetical protein